MPRVRVPVRNATTGLREAKPVSLLLASRLTSTVTGGINSTADVALVTLAVPANTLAAGDTLRFKVRGRVSKGSGGNRLFYWIKVGATKYVMHNHNLGTGSLNAVSWWFDGDLTFQSVGAVADFVAMSNKVTNTTTGISGMESGTADTTNSLSIVFGMNFNSASAGASFEAVLGGIEVCTM